jgi:hypothetical protein
MTTCIKTLKFALIPFLFLFSGAHASDSDSTKSDQQDDVATVTKSLKETSLSDSSEKKASTSLEETSEKKAGTWGNTFTNLYYNVTSKSQTEMDKFPLLSVATLLEQLHEEDKHTVLRVKKYKYRTGSHESAADFYDGWLHFTDLDYGEAEHHYQGPQIGFKGHTLISRREEIKPHKFISSLLSDNVLSANFYKGTPQKDSLSKTTIEYTIFSRAGNRYITVKAFRDLSEFVD